MEEYGRWDGVRKWEKETGVREREKVRTIESNESSTRALSKQFNKIHNVHTKITKIFVKEYIDCLASTSMYASRAKCFWFGLFLFLFHFALYLYRNINDTMHTHTQYGMFSKYRFHVMSAHKCLLSSFLYATAFGWAGERSTRIPSSVTTTRMKIKV